MIALGGPKLKPHVPSAFRSEREVSMIALGGPKLKRDAVIRYSTAITVSTGRTHEPQVVQDVENLYAGIFLKNRLRYRVAQN